MLIFSQNLPLSVLRDWAIRDPAQWADVYDEECSRRHPHYQHWLRQTGQKHSADALVEYMRRPGPSRRQRAVRWLQDKLGKFA